MLDSRGQIVSTVTTTRGQIMMQVNSICSLSFASHCVIDATDDDNSLAPTLNHLCRVPGLVLAGGQPLVMMNLQSVGVFTQMMQRPWYNALSKGVYAQ